VINLSDHDLTENETNVLALEQNYAVTQRSKLKIFSEFEKDIRALPEIAANTIRSKVTNVLNQAKPVISNLTKSENDALMNL